MNSHKNFFEGGRLGAVAPQCCQEVAMQMAEGAFVTDEDCKKLRRLETRVSACNCLYAALVVYALRWFRMHWKVPQKTKCISTYFDPLKPNFQFSPRSDGRRGCAQLQQVYNIPGEEHVSARAGQRSVNKISRSLATIIDRLLAIAPLCNNGVRVRETMTLVECDSNDSDDSPFGGNFNTVETGEEKLEKFKNLREQFDWGIKKERRAYFRKFKNLIVGWRDHLPDLRDFFLRKEIEWMLLECVKFGFNKFVCFVARTGYRDEPELDEDGNPRLRRTTPVHYLSTYDYTDDYSDDDDDDDDEDDDSSDFSDDSYDDSDDDSDDVSDDEDDEDGKDACDFWRRLVDNLFQIYDNFDVNYVDGTDTTHFHIACEYGCYDVVEKFLELGQDPDCLAIKSLEPPLHSATRRQHKDVVQLLLDHGADPNLTNKYGRTALHNACYKLDDSPEVAELFQTLFEICGETHRLALIDTRDKFGRTPLHDALAGGKKRMVAVLLRWGADPNLADADGSTPLHAISQRGKDDDDDLAEIFFGISDYIQQTVKVDALDKGGRAPLHWAVRNGNLKYVESLLRNGADPTLADPEGYAPLHLFCSREHDDGLIDMFFEICGKIRLAVQVNALNKLGRTPLHLALRNGKHKMVECLLRNGADPNVVDEEGLTSLHLICGTTYDDNSAERFFQICDDMQLTMRIDALDKLGQTPLHLALGTGKKKMVECLLRNGADPNIADAEGLTSLQLICGTTYDDNSAEKFIQICDDMQLTMRIDALDKLGRTPLHLALRNEKHKMVECLLRNGTDPNIADAEGLTSLHLIALRGIDDDMMEWFLEIGDNMQLKMQIDALDKLGRTPLYTALAYGRRKIAETLLRRGANPNLANSEGLTYLHFIALRKIDDDLVEKFIKMCSDIQQTVQVNALNKLGRTPLHLALRKGKQKMVESLLRNGADPNIADEKGYTCLHFIALRGIDDLAEKFFEICNDMQLKVQVNAQENHGRTPLQIAVCLDKEHVVESLLRNGADPNIADVEKCTSLHSICATDYDDDSAEKFLQICDDMQLTMQVDALSKLGWTPLHLALFKGKKKATEWLLRRGANPNLANKEGCTPLHAISCREVDDDFAEKFFQICDDIRQTVQVDVRDKRGRTPLHLALRKSKKIAAESLLRRGANTNLADSEGFTSLHLICGTTYDDNSAEKFFQICDDMQLPMRVDARCKLGWTPLHFALSQGKKKAAESLLRRGANANSADGKGFTSLHHIALRKIDDDLTDWFYEICDDIRQTLQVDARSKLDDTALHIALRYGCKKMVECLLRRGAHPDLADADGSTSLHIICKRECDDDLMDIFFKINDDMQQTVQVDVPDNLGSTPLHFAVLAGNKRIIETLLRKGVDPNSADVDGLTSLHHMALRKIDDDLSEKFFEICDELQRTLLVDVRSNFGNTPLHLALRNGKMKTAKSLLTRGADPYLADADGLTSIHIICKKIIDDDLTKDILQLIDDILQTVQVDPQDKSGKTSLYYAVSSGGNKQIIEALLDRIIEDEERGFVQNVPSE
ncbi:unnamed protein product [Trichogramma brassicae]|uniref:Uncharacterized protein n=1 Tax=Trichogramma brassicae TaxID=86971 RepID=A0A6H5IRR4_9HYME|nr:unnamed protein product [Trichogramma brassicae]